MDPPLLIIDDTSKAYIKVRYYYDHKKTTILNCIYSTFMLFLYQGIKWKLSIQCIQWFKQKEAVVKLL